MKMNSYNENILQYSMMETKYDVYFKIYERNIVNIFIKIFEFHFE